MAQLSEEKLFSDTLPQEWRPVLELLAELDALGASPGVGSLQARREQAAPLRAKLVEAAGIFAEDFPESLRSSSPDYKRWFTEGVLLWPWFAEAGGKIVVATIPTPSLANYPLDFAPTDHARAVLRRALITLFGWTEDELHVIDARVIALTSNLRLKRAMTRSLGSAFESADPSERKLRALALMREIYGDLPWRPGDVDVVITTTALFLCLPYQDTSLTVPSYDQRPADERQRIAAFLERVHTEQLNLKSVRFPAFGVFDAEVVAPELLSRLIGDVRQEEEFSQVEDASVRDTLATMVTVLPTADVEKFLVHDVWGHGWQQTICEFEWKFRSLAAIGEPIGGGQFAANAARLAEAFERRGGEVVLRPDVLLRTIEADLRGRIAVGMNLVVAEFLADLIEHKFSRRGTPLPSSSLLPDSTLKLDLSLGDARLMVKAWSKPYRRLIRDPAERQRLEVELRKQGFVDNELSGVVEQVARLVEQHFSVAFDDTISVGKAPEQVRVNVLERIVLGVATFDAAIERLLADGDARWRAFGSNKDASARWQCPIACIDLVALLVAWFYEQERELYVWHLDELVASEIGKTLQQLEKAIQSELGAG